MKSSRPRRHVVHGVAVAIAGVVLSACTFVPTDGQAQQINSKTVPFNLLVKHPGPKSK